MRDLLTVYLSYLLHHLLNKNIQAIPMILIETIFVRRAFC